MLNSSFVWTDDVRAEAVEMWRDGQSVGAIASFFSISRSAVSGYISRNRSLFDRRAPPGRPAKKPAVSVQAKPQAPKTRWTPEVVEKASFMWKAGLTAGVISDAIGCSETALYEFTRHNRDLFPKRLRASELKPVVNEALATASISRNLFDSTGYQLPGVQPIAFVAIGRGECRFPINSHDSHNGPEMPCCGAETGGMVYCPAHMSIARGRGTESERTAHRALRRVA